MLFQPRRQVRHGYIRLRLYLGDNGVLVRTQFAATAGPSSPGRLDRTRSIMLAIGSNPFSAPAFRLFPLSGRPTGVLPHAERGIGVAQVRLSIRCCNGLTLKQPCHYSKRSRLSDSICGKSFKMPLRCALMASAAASASLASIAITIFSCCTIRLFMEVGLRSCKLQTLSI